MTDAQFDAQVRAAMDRVTDLRKRADHADRAVVTAVLTEALEELALTFEELHVAQEELRVQNESLMGAEALAVGERDRYRDLFEFAPNGYLVTDPEGVVVESNRAARELLNVAGPRYVVHKPLVTFVHKEDREALHRQLTDLLRGQPAWVQTIRFQPRPEGTAPRTVEVTVVPFRDLGTHTPRLRWQLRDVTEQHAAAEMLRAAKEHLEARVQERMVELEKVRAENEELIARLQDADRRKDEFIATLAHELRNPLAPIRNAVEILHMVGPSDPTVIQARDMIDRQAVKLGRLVDDLLDVSRITRGKVTLHVEPTDVGEAVERAVEAARGMAKEKGVKLAADCAGGPLRALADPTRLDQIVTNLVTNAVKYTGKGGRVVVSVYPDGDRVAVRVKDTGVGIAPEMLAHVFELFVQVEGSFEQSQGGLGIGLHLVKHLVELHGGTVEAQSAGLGQGSEFVVRLPAAG